MGVPCRTIRTIIAVLGGDFELALGILYNLWIGRSLWIVAIDPCWVYRRNCSRRLGEAELQSCCHFPWSLQLGVLSQKVHKIRDPLAGISIAIHDGDIKVCCSRIPIRTPHAWLISSITRRRYCLKFLKLQVTFVEFLRESKVRSAACLHLNLSHYNNKIGVCTCIEIHLRAALPAVGFIQAWHQLKRK